MSSRDSRRLWKMGVDADHSTQYLSNHANEHSTKNT